MRVARRRVRRLREVYDCQRGMVTVEAALALAGLAAFLVIAVAALGAVAAQIRCVDAAREGARLAAAGDPRARDAAAQVAPSGASVSVRMGGDDVVVEVRGSVRFLPMLRVEARAVAVREPAFDDADAGG